MKKRVVFITDCKDTAYNELRGVILDNIKNEEIIIEPVVSVVPFSIINGNFAHLFPIATCSFQDGGHQDHLFVHA